MAHQQKPEGVPVPTVVISVIAVFVAGLLIGGFALRFGKKGSKDCDCATAAGAAGATAGAKRYRIYPRPHNPAEGPRTALVTLIEASDFQCPHCARAVGTIDQIRRAYPRDVRVVFMNNPLPMHRDARLAAVAGLAANAQGKFWPYHKLLFKHQRALKKPQLIQYAKQAGLNVAKFTKDLENRRIQIQVRQDEQQLRRLGVRSTPSFFINGRYIRGGRSFAQFKKIIDEEIAHARKLLKSGVARAQLYRELMKTAEFRIGGPNKRGKGARDRKRPPREDPNAVYKVPIKDRPWHGAKNAKVTIALFSDFQCPWCKRTEPLFTDIMKKFAKDVKVVWFDFPLRFHKNAMPAAIAAHEVYVEKGDKAFWAMHDKIFANNRNITDENLVKWAKEVGANGAKVAEALKTKKHEKAIRASQMTGQRIGVRGTPTILVNGKKYRGRRDIGTVSAMIQAEIKKADAAIGKAGVTLANYYNHIQKTALARVKYLPGSGGRGKRGRRPPRRQLDPNAIYKVEVSDKDISHGPKDALVTIVEWSDFQCPYCKWASCIAHLIMKAYPRDVRFIFRNNPLPFHRNALPAAQAAMAAFAQKGSKGFWAMHNKLFPTEKCVAKPPMPHIRQWLRDLPRTKMDLDLFSKYAQQIGLNVAQFKKDIESKKFVKAIKAQQSIAVRLGARGTPAFFINGKYIRGIRPFSRMKQIIDAQIAAAKKLMAEKRIPKSKVYQTIIAKGATAPVYLQAKGAAARPRIKIRKGGPPTRGRKTIRLKPRGGMH